MRYLTFLVALATFAASPALSHEFTAGDLVVDHPYSFETAQTALSGAGYLAITNNGSTPDRLLSVSAPFERIMLHNTEVDENGVARMLDQADGILIAPGETVTFAPGGLHIMFMGLGGDPFELGEKINATLTFENAGTLDVVFNVEERGAETQAVDHLEHSTE